MLFYIELCNLANYADANALSIIASTIELVLAALKRNTENTIKLVHKQLHACKPI